MSGTHDQSTNGPTGLTRRRFGALAAAGVGALVTGGITVVTLGRDGDGRVAVRHFDVRHSPEVYVTMTSGEEFVVEVKERGTGRVLEHHDGVTAYNLLSLESEHVAILDRS